MRSALYTGTVMHARRTPKENVFRYRVCFYLLDLDELPELDRRVRLFGWNRRGVVSLHDRDHMDVRAYLAERGIEAQGDSGLGVWVPLAEEAATVQLLLERGWAVSPGARYRFRAPPGIRITTTALKPEEARELARALGELRDGAVSTYAG